MTILTIKTGKFEQALNNDPSTSFWLKKQFDETKHRDPVDALKDAEILVYALKSRLQLLVEDETNLPITTNGHSKLWRKK